MRLKTVAGLYSAKFANFLIQEYRLGAGSTWPGHISLKIDNRWLAHFLKNKDLDSIVIVGTNGKTTTAKLLRHILEQNNHKVFQNEEGANLLNGIATTVIRNTSRFGNLKGKTAIFEVDENHLSHVLKQVTPRAIIFLNLFRDQLDRYGEVHTIATKWQKALSNLASTTDIILNADDPEIRSLSKYARGKIYYFSVPEKYFSKKTFTHDVDSVHCPECGTKLKFTKVAYSHLGKYTCPHCKFTNENIHDKLFTDFPHILFGSYNQYNLYAAAKTAREIFKIPYETIAKSLEDFKAAFGRQEKITYKNRDIYILLSKNPAGFNQSLAVTQELAKHPTVLLLLNDRIPDGRDISWIWDVDFEILAHAKNIIVSGDRVYDMAVRLKYAIESQNSKIKTQIFEDTKDAISELVKLTPEGETAFILPTYSAMLDARKILTGKELL